MNARIHLTASIENKRIAITGSKSETNRLLLLQALFPGIAMENSSLSDDSRAMEQALSGTGRIIDIQHAGTAMRFLTAFFAIQEGREVILTGSSRMKERPIEILVNALNAVGAHIEYTEKEGYPPLRIEGRKITGNKVTLRADVSSQYISALLLIAGSLEKGLEITLEGQITSMPYIDMTLALLREAGIESSFDKNTIIVKPKTPGLEPRVITVESDWSSASYFYSVAALSPGTTIELTSFRKDSFQGDAAVADIYKNFGVETEYKNNTILISSLKAVRYPKIVSIDLNDTPDLAQTIAVTCFGLGIGCRLTGLHTLGIKETDRIKAMDAELKKLGAIVKITDSTLDIEPSAKINTDVAVETYNDHRMALAFAPLAAKVPIVIKDAGVVSKSYPGFWADMEKLGFTITSENA